MDTHNPPTTNWKIILLLFAALLVLAACSPVADDAGSASETESLTVTLSEIQGSVQVLKPEAGFFADVYEGQVLQVGDQLLTHADGSAKLDFSSGTIVRVSPLTTFVIDSLANIDNFPTAELQLEVGEVWVILDGGNLTVTTNDVSATVQGSYMSVKGRLNKLGSFITCLEGNCRIENRVGLTDLVAGQLAEVGGESLPIRPGRMNPKHIERWLELNPEAEEILAAVTQTVQAYYGNDPEATATQAEAPEATPTEEGPGCGPPDGWTIHVVLEGETVASIAHAYGISETALRLASCLAAEQSVGPGQAVFVPNVPTITPTFTDTPVPSNTPVPPTKTPAPATNTPVPPTNTNTPVPPTATFTATNTPLPTATFTPSPTPTDTPTPTNTNTPTATYTPSMTPDPSTVYSNAAGPSSGVITVCNNFYSVDVADINGLQFVKLQFSVGAEPTVGSPWVSLSQSGATWYGTIAIDTNTNPFTDTVYWRFWARDGLGNDAYYPSSGGFAYTDPLNCTGN